MANHLKDPPDGQVSVVLKWKIAMTVAFTALLVLLFVHPVQHFASTPDVQSSIVISSSPSVDDVAPPTVVELPKVTPSVTPSSTATVVPPPINTIPLKAPPTWIDIPDAHISVDVSVLPMTESQRQTRYWVPPNVPNAFWVDSFDQPGAGSIDLSLIVAHACDGLAVCETIDWQFGRLSDTSLVREGTEIFVTTLAGKVCYVADAGPATYKKDQLEDAVDVWGRAPRPNKLVLISCYTGDIHERNVVVVASMVACGS